MAAETTNRCGGAEFSRSGGVHGCVREIGHHGAHEAASGARWFSYPGLVHGTEAETEACAECAAEAEAERSRLLAGGALRPWQRMPDDIRAALAKAEGRHAA